MSASAGLQKPPRNTQRDIRRTALHLFLIAMCVIWLMPLAWAVYTSLRPFAETNVAGYLSWPETLNLDNYVTAWNRSEMVRYFLNTLVVVVPAVLLVLLLASMMAFAVSRYSWRFNVAFLLLFTAANLLPPQVVITPLYRIYLKLWLPQDVLVTGFPSDNGLLYNQYLGLVLIHVAFQLGFCTFVLSNYMKTIPHELNEAAVMDGASVWKSYRSVIMPLTRPALAALATLQFTWVYNDFFWALVLINRGSKMPITTALNNLKGQFFTDYNLLGAGAVLVAIPTLIVFFALQKQFISGLTLGSTKG